MADKEVYIILAIVGIVAIVGLIFTFQGGTISAGDVQKESNLKGQADIELIENIDEEVLSIGDEGIEEVYENLVGEAARLRPPEKGVRKKCRDSDGGKNYYVKGHVDLEGFSPAYDYCFQKQLNEYVCHPYGWSKGNASCSRSDGCSDIVKYNCQNGCKNGACVK